MPMQDPLDCPVDARHCLMDAVVFMVGYPVAPEHRMGKPR